MGSENADTAAEQLSDRLIDRAAQRTVGQIEREISQKVQALYKKNLGHQAGRVTCQLFDTKLAIILENSITPPVQLLIEEGHIELAQRVRSDINSAMQPQVKTLVAEILNIEVLDLLSDATLETGRTGIIAILAQPPAVRNPEAIPKLKRAEKSKG